MSRDTDFFPPKISHPNTRDHVFRLLGTGAAHPTVEVGPGECTITRIGVGVFRIVWASNPGTFIGWSKDLGAATPADVKGHTVVRDTYDADNRRLDFSLFNAAEAADELQATEYLDFTVRFAED
jgi:hypothetical protein